MQKQSEFWASRLIRQFKRWGSSGRFTKPFAEFPRDIRAILTRQANLNDDEVPVVAFFVSEKRWVLTTSDRLVWKDGNNVTSLPWNHVIDAPPDLELLEELGEDCKQKLDQIQVETVAGSCHYLHLERGGPCFGLWNVVRMAAKGKRR